MSTADILSLVSLISYIVAGVAFVLALFFWFFFKIPSVIGDLSGRTAKKSIARIRENNERAAAAGHRSGAITADRIQGKRKTEKLAQEPKPEAPAVEEQRPVTGLLSSNKAEAVAAKQTGLLINTERAETAELIPVSTTERLRSGGKKLTMINEIMLIHTDEVI